MSYRDHVRRCNQWQTAQFMPFDVAGRHVGWFRRDWLDHITGFTEILSVSADRLRLSDRLDGPAARTAAMRQVVRALTDRGLTLPWRDEPYPVGTRFGENLFEIERAGAPGFGIRAYGIHVNGYVRRDDEISMWIPRRAADRAVAPGKLDNMIAGGQPAGLGLMENLIKEADEEASVSSNLACRARPVGALGYRMAVDQGLRVDVLFLFDLELPADFVPAARDGEVEDFRLLPISEVMAIVDQSDDFKFNCNLVLIDFFVRHGLIGPDHPDYLELIAGLRIC